MKEIIPTRLSKQLRGAAVRDFVIGLLITVAIIAVTILSGVEAVESFYYFTRDHEAWELDEILLSLLWLSLFGVIFSIRRFKDIKTLNAQISSLAYFDNVTHLPNRVFAADRLNQLISSAKRHHKEVAIVFIDFDRFKMVNDTYGHAFGDRLIKSVGERILGLIRIEDTLARLGGDEFLVLIDLENGQTALQHLLMRLTESQRLPHKVDDWESFVSFSMGVAIYPRDGQTSDELLVAADSAMYKAKEAGTGLYQFYSSNMGIDIANRYQLEVGLKQAIAKEQLNIQFQAIYDIQHKRVASYEVLLRWRFNSEMVPPESIIEIAEETHCIVALGNWVIEQAFRLAKQHLPKNVKVAINVSVTQFNQDDFVDNIRILVDKHQFDAKKLILEITESAFLLDYIKARGKISALRDLGISIAIDDFGTGHSSLGRLTELHVNSLKIDKSFIEKMEFSETDKNVVKAIIALAKQLKMETVAEGIETKEQFDYLRLFGCDKLQGYYIGRPMSAVDLSPHGLEWQEVQPK